MVESPQNFVGRRMVAATVIAMAATTMSGFDARADGWLSLPFGGSPAACDDGCDGGEMQWLSMPPGDGCDSPGCDDPRGDGGQKWTTKVRDKLDRWLGVDRSSGGDSGCDDGCHAMMIHELDGCRDDCQTGCRDVATPLPGINFSMGPTVASPAPAVIAPTTISPTIASPIPAPPLPRQNTRQRIDTGVVVPTPPRDTLQLPAQPLRDAPPPPPAPINSPPPLPPGSSRGDAMDLDDRMNDPFRDDAAVHWPRKVRRTTFVQ